jgi:hypothetical protein
MDGMKRNDGRRDGGYYGYCLFDYIADYSEIVNYCVQILQLGNRDWLLGKP